MIVSKRQEALLALVCLIVTGLFSGCHRTMSRSQTLELAKIRFLQVCHDSGYDPSKFNGPNLTAIQGNQFEYQWKDISLGSNFVILIIVHDGAAESTFWDEIHALAMNLDKFNYVRRFDPSNAMGLLAAFLIGAFPVCSDAEVETTRTQALALVTVPSRNTRDVHWSGTLRAAVYSSYVSG